MTPYRHFTSTTASDARRIEALTRREFMFSALGAALLVACGGDDDDDGASSTAESAGFPLTVQHKFGETTVPSVPERVVVAGFKEQDTLLALGVKPVAVREWWNEQPYATWSWARSALGDSQPVVLASEELDFEAIAGLQPDLIIGLYAGLTQDEYDTLSGIAPTVPQPAQYIDYGMPWQEEARMIGRLVGKEPQVEKLIEGVNQHFDEAAARYEAFQGKNVIFGGSNGDGTYWVYGRQDPRSRFLADLGFAFPTAIDEEGADEFYITLSAERARLMDVDAVVWVADDDAEIAAADQDAVIQQLKVAQDGRIVFVKWDSDLAGALSFSSVLSLPFAIDQITPMLSDAIARLT
jgi:iron complex transport system substrate-binding protein